MRREEEGNTRYSSSLHNKLEVIGGLLGTLRHRLGDGHGLLLRRETEHFSGSLDQVLCKRKKDRKNENASIFAERLSVKSEGKAHLVDVR